MEPSTVLMIRPISFRKNEQTSVNNYFQKEIENISNEDILLQAQVEFDNFVEKLKEVGINVIVFEDTKDPDTPDSVFPNNWISFHDDGSVVLYPMFAENRRLERRYDIIQSLKNQGFKITKIIDYSKHEENGIFLEGTGSFVIDKFKKKVYCALSPRSDKELFHKFCKEFNFTPITFNSYHNVNGSRKLIYHTNVMMSIAEKYAIICSDSIDDSEEKNFVLKSLIEDGKEIIEITEQQTENFSGNVIQLRGKEGRNYLIMSNSAYSCLTDEQKSKINKFSDILSVDLKTIETCGGGSARCMICEVNVPKE